MLTSGKDRDRDLVNFRRRQNKDYILRRLFQRLQKRVKRADGKHMHLVDDVHFVLSLRGTIRYLFPDLTDIVHAVIGRRVDLDHIHRRSHRDRTAHRALAAWTSVHRMLAVDRLCKYFRYRCLSCSACSAEQICMPDTVRFDLILQCCDNMILSFYIFK